MVLAWPPRCSLSTLSIFACSKAPRGHCAKTINRPLSNIHLAALVIRSSTRGVRRGPLLRARAPHERDSVPPDSATTTRRDPAPSSMLVRKFNLDGWLQSLHEKLARLRRCRGEKTLMLITVRSSSPHAQSVVNKHSVTGLNGHRAVLDWLSRPSVGPTQAPACFLKDSLLAITPGTLEFDGCDCSTNRRQYLTGANTSVRRS